MERPEVFTLIESFLEHLKQKHYAPRNILNIKGYLGIFAAYLEKREKEIRAVIPQDVEDFVHYLTYQYKPRSREKLSVSSIFVRLSSVRSLFRYLVKHRYLVYDPSQNMPYPRLSPRICPVLTRSEMEALLSSPDLRTWIGLRDRGILEVFYATGIRKGELLRLNLWDVDLKERVLRILKGKGGKDRVVPLGKTAAYFVHRYLQEARPNLIRDPKEPALFVCQYGSRLDYSALRARVQTYVKRVGLTKKVNCHMFRHTCATHLLEGGADIRYVQELLGHASLKTTQVYTRCSSENLKEILRKCHPRGKVKHLSLE